MGRHEEAIHCLDKALEIDPQNAETWINKGWSLGQLQLGRHEEAIHRLDKALELDPQNGKAWNNKGRSLGSLDRHEEAAHCFSKAMELNSLHALDSHDEESFYPK